jgi:hypothetical protein
MLREYYREKSFAKVSTWANILQLMTLTHQTLIMRDMSPEAELLCSLGWTLKQIGNPIK